MPIYLVQDTRTPTTQGRDRRRVFPDPTVPWKVRNIEVANNVVSDGSSCLLCVKDATPKLTGQQMASVDGNVYRRGESYAATALAMWSYGSAGSRNFTDLTSFRSSTGQEAHGRMTQAPLVTDTGQPVRKYRQIYHGIAQPIPADVAKAMGHTPGITHLGLFRIDF